MNNSFSLQQIQKTSYVDATLISRQNKINLMADFLRVNYENPKIKQFDIANQLGLFSSTLQIYRNDINMLSPYRINQNNNKKRTKKAKNANSDNDSQPKHDDKRPQMTSNDLKTTSNNETIKNKKNKLKGGGNIEINQYYLEEILQNNTS